MKIIDTNLKEINDLQERIMLYIDDWARQHSNTPISRKEIIRHMVEIGVKQTTTINAIKSLCIKKFIRPAVTISNTTSYVQLRGV